MVVIAGDDASGEVLLPWIGNGFRALGASSIAADPADAALPFDARRNGMLLGAGGIGMVLETEVCILGGGDMYTYQTFEVCPLPKQTRQRVGHKCYVPKASQHDSC